MPKASLDLELDVIAACFSEEPAPMAASGAWAALATR
jgi:hypothetical protein